MIKNCRAVSATNIKHNVAWFYVLANSLMFKIDGVAVTPACFLGRAKPVRL
jgi:hypothetical protein